MPNPGLQRRNNRVTYPNIDEHAQTHAEKMKKKKKNRQDADEGFTALAAAVLNGQTECARVLLSRGADSSIPTSDGRAPVFLAASVGHLPALRLLLTTFGHDRGAEACRPDAAGRTPVMAAAANGHLGCLRALVGADLASDGDRTTRLLPLGKRGSFLSSFAGADRLDDLLVVEENAPSDDGEDDVADDDDGEDGDTYAAPAWGGGERGSSKALLPISVPSSTGGVAASGGNFGGSSSGGGGGGGGACRCINDVDSEGRSALMHACMFDQVHVFTYTHVCFSEMMRPGTSGSGLFCRDFQPLGARTSSGL